MPTYERIRYETPDDHVARIVLARAEARNAQDRRMLYELNDAFDVAAQDEGIRVVILAADGPDFSSGHDLRDRSPMSDFEPVSCWGGFDAPGAEGIMAHEEEYFLGLCWRWRNFPKPTIAAVQGRAIAGGLMLIWPCDLIVASEDALFSDPVVAFGLNGHEFFVHAWELGPRRAKEMLFTGEAVTAEEAKIAGMVNRIVPRDDLERASLDLARRIALRPTMGVKLAKQAVNQSIDAQGLWTAVQAAYSLHLVGHTHNLHQFGKLIDPSGLEILRQLAKESLQS